MLRITLKKSGTIHKSYLYSVLHLAKNMHIGTDTFYYTKALLNINRIFLKLQINIKPTSCKYLIRQPTGTSSTFLSVLPKAA